MYKNETPPVQSRAFHDALYAGAIIRFRQVEAMRNIVGHTRGFLESRLKPYVPIDIHRHVEPAALPALLSAVQRDYHRCTDAHELWHQLFASLGFDAASIARDRLILRFQPPQAAIESSPWQRSTATVGFHRDTWGTNLYCQVNWWAPVYPITNARTFALYPSLWDRPLANNSREFDLKETMRRIRETPGDLKPGDLLPRATQAVDPQDAAAVTIEPGSIIAFSAQHAHAGVINRTTRTRISIDTRSLLIEDYLAHRGAPNIDGSARFVAPGLFHRLSDGKSLADIAGSPSLDEFAGLEPSDG